MSTCDLTVGQQVSVAQWDKTEPRRKWLGDPAEVVEITPARGQCQSGFMVTVRGSYGGKRTLDRDWLLPAMAK